MLWWFRAPVRPPISLHLPVTAASSHTSISACLRCGQWRIAMHIININCIETNPINVHNNFAIYDYLSYTPKTVKIKSTILIWINQYHQTPLTQWEREREREIARQPLLYCILLQFKCNSNTHTQYFLMFPIFSPFLFHVFFLFFFLFCA